MRKRYLESNLPKWAQEKIRRLERDLQNKENEIEVLKETKLNKGSRCRYTTYATHDQLELPDGCSVRQYLLPKGDERVDKDSWCEQWVDTRIAQEGDEYYLNVMGGSGMKIVPIVSNSIRIYIESKF